jgi:hypothetical protein
MKWLRHYQWLVHPGPVIFTVASIEFSVSTTVSIAIENRLLV